MPFYIIALIIDVAFVVHILKTERNTIWMYIVIALPFVGSMAYVLIELLPAFYAGPTGRKIKRLFQKVINQNKNLNQAVKNVAVSDSIENRLILANECMKKALFEEAQKLFESSLKGVHKYDPDIMYGLAQSEFELGNYEKSKIILDEIIKENPEYKNADAHLLYAKTAEGLKDFELASHEYEALIKYYPGSEASFRYAILLKQTGDNEKSRKLMNDIIMLANSASKQYINRNKKWITLAKNNNFELNQKTV